MGESEAVIELLRKEIEELKVALAEAGKAPLEVNPRLTAELEKVWISAMARLNQATLQGSIFANS